MCGSCSGRNKEGEWAQPRDGGQHWVDDGPRQPHGSNLALERERFLEVMRVVDGRSRIILVWWWRPGRVSGAPGFKKPVKQHLAGLHRIG
jgi:hypothetical protein